MQQNRIVSAKVDLFLSSWVLECCMKDLHTTLQKIMNLLDSLSRGFQVPPQCPVTRFTSECHCSFCSLMLNPEPRAGPVLTPSACLQGIMTLSILTLFFVQCPCSCLDLVTGVPLLGLAGPLLGCRPEASCLLGSPEFSS